jgi:hypothetical protein
MPRDSEKLYDLIPIYRPYNQQEIALIKTILDGAGIRYFIRNEFITIGSLSPTSDAFTELSVEKSKVRERIELLG